MTSKSTKRRNAVIAAIAGAALLLGGSTYALWSANVPLSGGTIVAGELKLTGKPMETWDISKDRTDNQDGAPGNNTGHPINDPAKWRMVPGDRVAMVFPYTVTLKGDNLVAELTIEGDFDKVVEASERVSVLDGNGDPVLDEQDNPVTEPAVTLKYQLFDSAGADLSQGEQPVPTDAKSIFVSYFQDNDDAGQAAGEPDGDITRVGVYGSRDVTFVLYVDFSKLATDSHPDAPPVVVGDQNVTDMSKQLFDLGSNVRAVLNQVRCTTVDSNFSC